MNLPLTVFEEYLLWENRRAYPCSVFLRLRFSGVVQRQALTEALTETLQRHPQLRSKVEEKKRGRFSWTPVEDPQPTIRWIDAPVGGPFPDAEHQDLSQEIGLRVFVVRDQQNSELVLQFHHACCDGAGIIAFIRDLLFSYARRQGAEVKRSQLPKLDPQRLIGRGKLGLTFWKLLKKAPRQAIGLLGAKEFFQHKPAPVTPCSAEPDDHPPPPGYPATCCYRFDKQQTAALKFAAIQRGATLNDLLIRDFFLALRDWRVRQGVEDDQQWLRMMVPVNLRSKDDRRLSATNVVSSVFLDRRGKDLKDGDQLLQGIHDQMQLIKRNELGLTFIFSLSLLRRLPGGLKKMAREDSCTVSCILTNLGRVLWRSLLPTDEGRWVAGDIRLDEFDILAPLRPYCGVSIAVHIYAGRLGLSMHYDPRVFTAQQAEDLLDTFTHRLLDSVSAADPD